MTTPMHEERRVIYDASRMRRVEVFRCDDGTFSYSVATLQEGPQEPGWTSHTVRPAQPCESLEAALQAAKGGVDWLADCLPRA